jgi:hypothetical protein
MLSLGPLNGLGPLDVEGNIGKVTSLLFLLGLRAAIRFQSGAFVGVRCGRNRENGGVFQIILERLAVMFGYLGRLNLSFRLSWLKAGSHLFMVLVNALAAQLSNAFWHQVNIEVLLPYFP